MLMANGKISGLTVVSDTEFTIKLKQPEADFPLRLGYSASSRFRSPRSMM